MPNPFETQIKDRIQAFAQELDTLVRRNMLDALRGMLDAGSTTVARRGRGPGRRPGRPRGTAGDVDGVAASIVSHVQSHDGQTVGEISKAVGATAKSAKKAILKLLASGALKKTGQKRGTRYHVGSGSAPAAKRGKRRGRKVRRAKAA